MRSLLLEIANIERQPLWAIGKPSLDKGEDNCRILLIHHLTAGACSFCSDGGDCITGAKTVMEENGDQPLEIFLKLKNPQIFFMLNFALKRVFGRSGPNFKTALKSFVLDYKYNYREFKV